MEKKTRKAGANCKCSRSDRSKWDSIFEEIQVSLHEDLPLRVRNWLKNKFTAPEIKNQDVNTGNTIQKLQAGESSL